MQQQWVLLRRETSQSASPQRRHARNPKNAVTTTARRLAFLVEIKPVGLVSTLDGTYLALMFAFQGLLLPAE